MHAVIVAVRDTLLLYFAQPFQRIDVCGSRLFGSALIKVVHDGLGIGQVLLDDGLGDGRRNGDGDTAGQQGEWGGSVHGVNLDGLMQNQVWWRASSNAWWVTQREAGDRGGNQGRGASNTA